jgi:hypothetical protein
MGLCESRTHPRFSGHTVDETGLVCEEHGPVPWVERRRRQGWRQRALRHVLL